MDRSTMRRLLDLMSRDIPRPRTLQDRLREHERSFCRMIADILAEATKDSPGRSERPAERD